MKTTSSRGVRWLASMAVSVRLAAALAASCAVPVTAQIAVPYYGPEAFVAALQARHQAPQAEWFAAAARMLADAADKLCTSPDSDELPGGARVQARQAWIAAADAWERLQAVALGPTIERGSVRGLDFRPARPALIKRAIAARGSRQKPPDTKALERVGAPAKGLPALEWLLWDPAAPQTPAACRYAAGLAQEVQREAQALAAAHAAEAARDWRADSKAAEARADQAVNQWLAGLEGLRWRQLGKPLSIVATAVTDGAKKSAARPDIWPRPDSGSHREAWLARWESLRSLAIGPAPTDGFSAQPAVPPAVVSLEALLRGRGLNRDADAWAQAVMTADQAMQALTRESPAPGGQPLDAGMAPQAPREALPPPAVMQAAVGALDEVRQFMQEKVAPALEVTLGFSDADGD